MKDDIDKNEVEIEDRQFIRMKDNERLEDRMNMNE